MRLQSIASRVRHGIYLGLVAIVLCSGLTLGMTAPAVAGEKAAGIVENRAEQELDRVAGAGTADQIQGSAQEGLGKVQRQFGNTENQIKGAAKQVQGRAQKDIGRTQAAAEDAAGAIEDSSQGFVESVKDFFN